MPNVNVELSDHLDRFVEAGVASGRFSNASEAVREALHLLEQREEKDQAILDRLRAAAKEGFDQLDRGEGIEFDSMDDLADHIGKIGDEVSSELAVERKCG